MNKTAIVLTVIGFILSIILFVVGQNQQRKMLERATTTRPDQPVPGTSIWDVINNLFGKKNGGDDPGSGSSDDEDDDEEG